MPLKQIQSRDNPEYRHLVKLSEDSRLRREVGQTLLDGWHLIESALQAGCTPEKLICTAGQPLPSEFEHLAADITLLELSQPLMRALSPVKTPSGLMALLPIPKPVQTKVTFAMLLEDVQDPGNLGALLRTAAAAGVQAVYLSQGCADAWSPKALRGGQGGHFHLAIHEHAQLPAIAADFSGPVYAAVLGAKASLFQLDLNGPAAFAFGNEGAGLSNDLQKQCQPFAIPMPGQVESLNVGTAAAVCLFERVRQLQSI